jgi:hypothetical protein
MTIAALRKAIGRHGIAISGDGTRLLSLYSDGSYGVGSGAYFDALPTPE